MRAAKLSILTLLLVLLAGCGFQLRGTAELPFETLYIPGTGGGIGLGRHGAVQMGL